MHREAQGISGQAHGSDAPRGVTFVIVIDNSNIEARIQGDKPWRSTNQSSMNSSAKRSVIWARRSAPRWYWSATDWDFTRNSREAQSLLLNLRNARQPTNATFANGWVIKAQAATFNTMRQTANGR